jgi:enoyl-CoA hydratase
MERGGPARVTDIIFTARLLDAEDARSVGLVSEVLPDAAVLVSRAEELARLVAGHAPLTLRATNAALLRLRGQRLPPDGDLIRLCYASADFREGMAAFLGKRVPVWQGL